MATAVIMPKLGLTMTEGQVVAWRVRPGDPVAQGQVILEIMTEKISYEIEAPAGGVVQEIVVPEGETVLVGTPLAYIGAPEELTKGIVAPAPTEMVAAASPATPPGEMLPLSPMRQVIAQRMAASFREAPHFVLTVEADMTECLRYREYLNAALAPKNISVSFTDMLVKAVALALRQHPEVNASFEKDHIRRHLAVNVGVAVSTPEGLLVPVVRDADAKSLAEIAQETADLAERARRGGLSPDEVSGGTFTVTNLGMFGVDLFHAIINPPQAAILAVGRIAERPAVIEGQVVPRPTAFLCLSCDHRVLDGAAAAAFLRTLKEILENPFSHLGPP